MFETLAHGYSSESHGTQRELSDEYQHHSVKMVFKNLCILVFWTKVASSLEGLIWCSVTNRSLNELYVWDLGVV